MFNLGETACAIFPICDTNVSISFKLLTGVIKTALISRLECWGNCDLSRLTIEIMSLDLLGFGFLSHRERHELIIIGSTGKLPATIRLVAGEGMSAHGEVSSPSYWWYRDAHRLYIWKAKGQNTTPRNSRRHAGMLAKTAINMNTVLSASWTFS